MLSTNACSVSAYCQEIPQLLETWVACLDVWMYLYITGKQEFLKEAFQIVLYRLFINFRMINMEK